MVAPLNSVLEAMSAYTAGKISFQQYLDISAGKTTLNAVTGGSTSPAPTVTAQNYGYGAIAPVVSTAQYPGSTATKGLLSSHPRSSHPRSSGLGSTTTIADPYTVGTTPAPVEPNYSAGAVVLSNDGGGGSNAGVVDPPGVTTMATTANKVWIPWGGETMGGYWADAPAAQAQPDTGMDLSSVFGAYNIPISIGNSDAQTLYRALAIDNAQGNNNAVNTLAQAFGTDPASVMSDTALWNSPAMQSYAAQRVAIGNKENMLADLLQGAAWVGGGALGINSLLNPAGVSGLLGDLTGSATQAVTPAAATPYSATSIPVSPLLNTGSGAAAIDPVIANAAGVPSVASTATTTGGLLTPTATTAGIDAAIPSIVSAPATGGLTLADLAPAAAGTATTAGGVSPAIAAAAGVPSITGATTGLAGLDSAIAAAAGVPSIAGGLATGTSALAGATPGAALTAAQLAGVAAPAATAATASNGLFGNIADALGVSTNTLSGLLGTGLNALSGYMNTSNAADAAAQQAATQLKIADMFRFRPVGVTTRFGSSQFGYDPITGNLNSASYNVAPEVKALQDSLMGAAPGLLGQFTGAQTATAPMGTAAQAAMNLGNQYLATSPQAQAQKYMNEQMALIQPQNERALAALEAKLQAQGRLGLATGGTSTLAASNPELEALYNAQKMQQLQLAANATQGGMDYAKFGTAMAGAGGDLLTSMYNTQNAAFNPYSTALTGANTIEQLGQNAMNLGTSIGAQQSTANAIPANMMNQAAATQATANAASPWASLLGGVGSTLQNNSLLSALTNQNLWGT